MDAKLVFFKYAFNILVCQSYCGVRFVSFTLLPALPAECPAFAFQDFSRYLEFFVFENVSLCVLFIQEFLDTSRGRGLYVSFLF